MKIAHVVTSPLGEPGFKYEQPLWGDWIVGTKEQLQRIGIGAGLPFPGEPGANKRHITVTDPRGFKARISPHWEGDGRFTVRIDLPGRKSQDEEPWREIKPGVYAREEVCWNEFKGSPEALLAAGLLMAGKYPGQPGMAKTRVKLAADGRVLSRNANVWPELGGTVVERESRGHLLVRVDIADISEEEEVVRRHAEAEKKKKAWEDRMRSLPRPAPLIPLSGDRREVKRKPQYRADGNVLHVAPSNTRPVSQRMLNGGHTNVISFPGRSTVAPVTSNA